MPPDLLNSISRPIQGPAFESGLTYKKADLHLHSNYSYDVLNLPQLSPRALYDKAVRQGMGFFTLTDHDTMRGILALEQELRDEFGDQPPIPTIRGIEIKVKDRSVGHTIHVNVLGLDASQWLDLARRRKNLDAFLEFCREHRLYHAYNHPFWFEKGERGSLEKVTELIGRFPIIELNAGRIPQLNHRTATLARRFGKQIVATSDSHTGQVGKGHSLAPGATPEEFLDNLLRGVSIAAPQNATFSEFMEEVRHTIELVFGDQDAFRMKPTFLRTNPVARAIAKTALGNDLFMRPGRIKRSVCRSLQIIAHGPAYAFIHQQRRMHAQLGGFETMEAIAL